MSYHTTKKTQFKVYEGRPCNSNNILISIKPENYPLQRKQNKQQSTLYTPQVERMEPQLLMTIKFGISHFYPFLGMPCSGEPC